MSQKGSKEHKKSSKTKSTNKSEKNINPDNQGSDFNNRNNVKPENRPRY